MSATTGLTRPPPAMTPERAIELYIKLRDKKAELEAAHKDALRPYVEAMERLEGTLLVALDAAGVDRMGSREIGTAYKSTRTSVTVSRWSETLDYIRDNEAWELLDARVNKTAALAIEEETKQPVPGTTTRREIVVQVRRP